MAIKGKIMRLETDYSDDPRASTRVRYADGTAFGSPHAAPKYEAAVSAEETLYPFHVDSAEVYARSLHSCSPPMPCVAKAQPIPLLNAEEAEAELATGDSGPSPIVVYRAAEAELATGDSGPSPIVVYRAAEAELATGNSGPSPIVVYRAKEGASKFQLSLAHAVPGAPRTETLIFATGRGAPVMPVDEIRDTALRVLRDGVSMAPETVVGLCNALLDLDARLSHKSEQLEIARLQLSQARDAMEAYVLDLKAAREAALQAEVLRVAALEDALQQRILAIQLSEDNRTLRLAARPSAESTACLDRASCPSAESSAYLDLQVLIDEQSDDQCAADALDAQWDEEDDCTVVQDAPYGAGHV